MKQAQKPPIGSLILMTLLVTNEQAMFWSKLFYVTMLEEPHHYFQPAMKPLGPLSAPPNRIRSAASAAPQWVFWLGGPTGKWACLDRSAPGGVAAVGGGGKTCGAISLPSSSSFSSSLYFHLSSIHSLPATSGHPSVAHSTCPPSFKFHRCGAVSQVNSANPIRTSTYHCTIPASSPRTIHNCSYTDILDIDRIINLKRFFGETSLNQIFFFQIIPSLPWVSNSTRTCNISCDVLSNQKT